MGPTAAGKTDLAVALRQKSSVDLISVDSALVYRYMDIGTAKPDLQTLATAPHALIDIRDPWESYSAADFVTDATACIERSHAAGRIPVLVGGTMLYFRALLQGIAEMPATDAQVRASVAAQAQKQGWAAMHRRLAEIDPQSAHRIHPNDPQRIQRALEVYEMTGKPISVWHQAPATPAPWPHLDIVVSPERALLRERAAVRFERMLELGFLQEMERLMAMPKMHRDLPSMRSVGYRQAWSYLAKEYTFDAFRERAVTATRQLAKRQITWLRKWPQPFWLDPTDPKYQESAFRQIDAFLTATC